MYCTCTDTGRSSYQYCLKRILHSKLELELQVRASTSLARCLLEARDGLGSACLRRA